MKALVHERKSGMDGLQIKEIQSPEIQKNEVRISVKYAGLNHRDLINMTNHKELDKTLYMGEDAAGVVKEVGDEVTSLKVGDKVMINAGLGWKKKSKASPERFHVIGNTTIGSFAEEIVYPAESVVKVPDYLTMEEAGAFSLGGLTAYRALVTQGQVEKGMKVLIPGIGGGVANFLLRFAKAAGASVYVTSRSNDKLSEAKSSGADKLALDEEDWTKKFDGKVDLVIESVGAATFNKSLDTLKPGGTMVLFGSSTGDKVEFNLRNFFYQQYTLKGSTMGSQEELEEMISFSEKHSIKPLIDQVYNFEDYQNAFERLKKAEQTGKIVLKISD
ncbi:MAG: zinc-binding dehydrogenase [Pisciglobus halotolerans]|nr:zinc-binding dehydrogenase [Pisciglobus halotolerans]